MPPTLGVTMSETEITIDEKIEQVIITCKI